jgi:HAE1 family hydrophobic/amphiphilic exporter-1
MWLADVSVRRPVFAAMLIAFLTIFGLFAYKDLGVDLFPKVDFPNVSVITLLEGASPEEIETRITKPIEEAVNTVSGIDELRSVSLEGVSRVYIQFVLEKPVDVAAQEVREKVAGILAQLPEGTDPPLIEKLDPDASPILALAVSGRRTPREVTEIARKQIKEPLETVTGVGSITMVGGREREVHVWIDPRRLEAHGLTIVDVRQALQRQHLEVPGGRITFREREAVLRTMGRLERPEEFADLVVAYKGGAPIRIRDLGRVEDGAEEPRSISRLNGEPAVSLLIRRQSGTNAVEVVERLHRHLGRIKAGLPSDIQIAPVRDQSRFVKRSFAEVRTHLILGAILASAVVLLFLRNWRSVVIAAVAIPTSIIATFTVIKYLGFTLNNMTMLALSVCTGIVIDDAIVVLENIYRYIEEKGYAPWEAAKAATAEIGLAVMATTFSLVVIFLPVAFMAGIPGRFWFYFGITATFAILISLLVSFTLTPMLASKLIRRGDGGHQVSKAGAGYRAVDRVYDRMLRWSLAHRGAVVGLATLAVASLLFFYPAIGKELVPADDQSEFQIEIKAPEGSSLDRTDAIVRQIEARAAELPGVREVFTTIGVGEGSLGVGGQVNTASVYVGLVPIGEREVSQFALMARARKIMAGYPELRSSVSQVARISGGGRSQRDLNLVLQGPDLEELDRYAQALVERGRQIPGLVDMDTTLEMRKPEVRVWIDRRKAADLGVSVEAIAHSLRTMVGGEEITKFKEGDEQYPVRLRLLEEYRKDQETIARLSVPSARGEPVPLDNLVRLTEERSAAQIDRFNRSRQVTVVANFQGIHLKEGQDRLTEKVRALNFPADYSYAFIGRSKIYEQAIWGFFWATVTSMIFIYMVLAAQFNSYLHPVTIMACLPVSLPFGFLSLMLAGMTLNVYSMIGMLLLFGIIKKNSILQVDYTNTLRARGVERMQAILEANHTRLRPILMTTFAVVAGMLPIAFGRGDGAASRASTAMVIVGGQMLALILTLLITPVVYSLLDDLRGVRATEIPRLLVGRLRMGWAGGVSWWNGVRNNRR